MTTWNHGHEPQPCWCNAYAEAVLGDEYPARENNIEHPTGAPGCAYTPDPEPYPELDALWRQAERWSEALTGAVALQAGCLVTAAVINEYRADVAASLYARQQRAWNVARANREPCPILSAGWWHDAIGRS